MKTTTVVHQCAKETEIALIQTDMKYMREKLDSIHTKLMGNGKPGLFSEIDQIKGSVKAITIIGGFITFCITVAIFYFNYLKK